MTNPRRGDRYLDLPGSRLVQLEVEHLQGFTDLAEDCSLRHPSSILEQATTGLPQLGTVRPVGHGAG